jgi:hypothetical protein
MSRCPAGIDFLKKIVIHLCARYVEFEVFNSTTIQLSSIRWAFQTNPAAPRTKLTLASNPSSTTRQGQIDYLLFVIVRKPARLGPHNQKEAGITFATMPYDDSDSASSVGSIVEDASEPDTTTFKCLFCDQEWARVPEMGAHCKSEHGFDLSEAVKSLGSSLSFTPCLFWSLD